MSVNIDKIYDDYPDYYIIVIYFNRLACSSKRFNILCPKINYKICNILNFIKNKTNIDYKSNLSKASMYLFCNNNLLKPSDKITDLFNSYNENKILYIRCETINTFG